MFIDRAYKAGITSQSDICFHGCQVGKVKAIFVIKSLAFRMEVSVRFIIVFQAI